MVRSYTRIVNQYNTHKEHVYIEELPNYSFDHIIDNDLLQKMKKIPCDYIFYN